MHIYVSTSPFNHCEKNAFEKLLTFNRVVFDSNRVGRRHTIEEMREILPEVDILIAGTEKLTEDVLRVANRLKLISRVGIGIDNIDLEYCAARGIEVTNTPDAPSDAVAELTLALMLNCIRGVNLSDRSLHNARWHRHLGQSLFDINIGIVGFGRIGSRVYELLSKLGVSRLRIYDNDFRVYIPERYRASTFEELTYYSDLITFHTPLNDSTKNMVNASSLTKMRLGVHLVNTARYELFDTDVLIDGLRDGRIGHSALDVFDPEPYKGPLIGIENLTLTAHLGSMTERSRVMMETGAVQEVLRYLSGLPRTNVVGSKS